MKLRILDAVVLSLLIGAVGPALAQTVPVQEEGVSTPSLFKLEGTGPDISGLPFIQSLAKTGATFHYMGERSGLESFLLVKRGQIQMLYITPDKKSVLIGGLFTDEGEMVTSAQLESLMKRDKKVAAIMQGGGRQSIDIIRAGMKQGGVAEVSGDDSSEKVETIGDLPLMPSSPGERLVMDLKASSGVILGNTKAPEVLMVVSPNCTFCKGTWDGLKEAVKKGDLQVRLIPISRNPEGDEIRIAAQLLRAKDPLVAWESYLSGNKDALAGEPDKAAYRAIVANRVMTDRWNIIGTPYLVYRSKDKNIKIVQGKPERTAAILADLIR